MPKSKSTTKSGATTPTSDTVHVSGQIDRELWEQLSKTGLEETLFGRRETSPFETLIAGVKHHVRDRRGHSRAKRYKLEHGETMSETAARLVSARYPFPISDKSATQAKAVILTCAAIVAGIGGLAIGAKLADIFAKKK